MSRPAWWWIGVTGAAIGLAFWLLLGFVGWHLLSKDW